MKTIRALIFIMLPVLLLASCSSTEDIHGNFVGSWYRYDQSGGYYRVDISEDATVRLYYKKSSEDHYTEYESGELILFADRNRIILKTTKNPNQEYPENN